MLTRLKRPRPQKSPDLQPRLSPWTVWLQAPIHEKKHTLKMGPNLGEETFCPQTYSWRKFHEPWNQDQKNTLSPYIQSIWKIFSLVSKLDHKGKKNQIKKYSLTPESKLSLPLTQNHPIPEHGKQTNHWAPRGLEFHRGSYFQLGIPLRPGNLLPSKGTDNPKSGSLEFSSLHSRAANHKHRDLEFPKPLPLYKPLLFTTQGLSCSVPIASTA